MTRVIEFERDDVVVRELLAPFARVQAVTLRRHPTGRRVRRLRPILALAVGAALALAGAGVAAATGVLPWWSTQQAVLASPFFTATDPAAVAGSTVRLSVSGPESTTFEVVTNNTATVGTLQEHCTAIVVKSAQGRSPGRGLTSCGAAGAAVANAGSFDWQAPSGATYAVISGPTPVATAAKVALVDSRGVTVTAEPVEGGYYLVYAPAEQAAGSLVFYNDQGQVVDELGSPHP